MKKSNNDKLMLTSKGKLPKRSKSDVITALVKELTTPLVSAPPPVVPAPTPQPTVSAPSVVSAPVMGEYNLGSRRITPGTPIRAYRIANNQRKNVEAKYYVQGGINQTDPVTLRDHFVVAVEIPYTELHSAKLKLVELRATLVSAPVSAPTTEVTKIA